MACPKVVNVGYLGRQAVVSAADLNQVAVFLTNNGDHLQAKICWTAEAVEDLSQGFSRPVPSFAMVVCMLNVDMKEFPSWLLKWFEGRS